ncbi:MAG: class I SAM-dependent methyltransferase [Vicinamibacterales bacterium]
MYDELAAWWPLISAPADYAEEADSFLRMIAPDPNTRPTMLELGSGGGNLASHLKAHFALTLSDVSPGMLAVSRALNPELPHLQGDMRTLRLDRRFDVVLIHDAVAYCATIQDLRAAIDTAVAHCRPGGLIVVAPDCVRETFAPATDHGGEDAPDGRAARYLEWWTDPDPADSQVRVVYVIALREADGTHRVIEDIHTEGLFSDAEWLEVFAAAGAPARFECDAWGRHVFIGRAGGDD